MGHSCQVVAGISTSLLQKRTTPPSPNVSMCLYLECDGSSGMFEHPALHIPRPRRRPGPHFPNVVISRPIKPPGLTFPAGTSSLTATTLSTGSCRRPASHTRWLQRSPEGAAGWALLLMWTRPRALWGSTAATWRWWGLLISWV